MLIVRQSLALASGACLNDASPSNVEPATGLSHLLANTLALVVSSSAKTFFVDVGVTKIKQKNNTLMQQTILLVIRVPNHLSNVHRVLDRWRCWKTTSETTPAARCSTPLACRTFSHRISYVLRNED
jgi:hypothetical protein